MLTKAGNNGIYPLWLKNMGSPNILIKGFKTKDW